MGTYRTPGSVGYRRVEQRGYHGGKVSRPAMRLLTVVGGALAMILNYACATSIRTPKRHEVGFLVGGTQTETETVNGLGAFDIELESSRTLQAYYAYRLTDYQKPVTLHLDVPLLAVPGRDVTASNEHGGTEYSSVFLTPGLKARAEITGSRIFFTGNVGAGWARFREAPPPVSGAPNREPVTTNSLGVAFGAGLGIQVTSAFDVRLEVRGVSAERGLTFDEPGKRVLNNMGFFGVDFRF